MKKTINLLMLLVSINIVAQLENIFEVTPQAISTFDKRNKNVKGSRFIEDNFSPAKLSKISGRTLDARYNCLDDYFEVKANGKVNYLTPITSSYIRFINTGEVYKSFNYLKNDRVKRGFFIIDRVNENTLLLTKQVIKFYEEVKPKSGYEKYKRPELKRKKDEYYIKLENKENAVKLPTKKKKIIQFLKKDTKKLKKYIKSEKLDLSKKEDLIMLLKYSEAL